MKHRQMTEQLEYRYIIIDKEARNINTWKQIIVFVNVAPFLLNRKDEHNAEAARKF